MATRIRLRRVGRKKQPSYRIVVIDKQKARDGRFVELLGHYDPQTDPVTIKVDQEKALSWLAKGATPSETVRSLLKKAGVFQAADAAPTATAAPTLAAEAAPATEAAPAPEETPADTSAES